MNFFPLGITNNKNKVIVFQMLHSRPITFSDDGVFFNIRVPFNETILIVAIIMMSMVFELLLLKDPEKSTQEN